MTTKSNHITRRALLVKQSDQLPLYLFSLTADELELIAGVSRVARTGDGDVIGYQSGEVRKHIENIVDYLNSDGPLLPNAIVLAISSKVRFTRSRGPNTDDGIGVSGVLEIPIPSTNEPKPAFIVDGQQRARALQLARNRQFAVPVSAFVTDLIDVQREQFIRVNSSRPLPAGLVTELLPQISTPISPKLANRRIPSALVDQLGQDDESPFEGLIRRPSMSAADRKRAVVTDTSLVKALEEALASPSSCLFPYRNIATNETDTAGIWATLVRFWSTVRDVFPDAWGLPASQSRLMHGVGIRSMSRLMDRVMVGINPTTDDAEELIGKELTLIAPRCRWTSGEWEDLGWAWNQPQNVPRDIKVLSNHLIRLYLQAKAGR